MHISTSQLAVEKRAKVARVNARRQLNNKPLQAVYPVRGWKKNVGTAQWIPEDGGGSGDEFRTQRSPPPGTDGFRGGDGGIWVFGDSWLNRMNSW
jgi:hypothetical protein